MLVERRIVGLGGGCVTQRLAAAVNKLGLLDHPLSGVFLDYFDQLYPKTPFAQHRPGKPWTLAELESGLETHENLIRILRDVAPHEVPLTASFWTSLGEERAHLTINMFASSHCYIQERLTALKQQSSPSETDYDFVSCLLAGSFEYARDMVPRSLREQITI